jgi:hypothetical protein
VMAARHCSSTSARFTFLEALGLITSSCKPHSALTQPTIHFDIHTPPRCLRAKPLPAAPEVRTSLSQLGLRRTRTVPPARAPSRCRS